MLLMFMVKNILTKYDTYLLCSLLHVLKLFCVLNVCRFGFRYILTVNLGLFMVHMYVCMHIQYNIHFCLCVYNDYVYRYAHISIHACMYTYAYTYVYVLKSYISRLMIVSCDSKEKQQPLSECFTRNTSIKFVNALATPPL